jgi:glycosyltransferase involved in cell wall biosynthesis
MKKNKTRILFITPSLRSGGAEKNMVNTINMLDIDKYSITLLICGGENNYQHLLPSSLDVIYLSKSSVSKAYPNLLKEILSLKPDIVFTSAGHVSIPIEIIKSLFFRRFIHIARVPTLPSNKLGSSFKSKTLSFFSKYAYKNTNYIIAQTDEMKAEIENVYGVSSEKVMTIPNLINRQQIEELSNVDFNCFDQNKFNIVAMGTLYSVKGFDLLIKAIDLVKRKHHNVMLYIIGQEGTEKGCKLQLEQIVHDLNLEKQVLFLGFQSNPYPYLKHADLFVLSSRKEGFPNVVLESLATGTPVVATNCVSFDNVIIDGYNGFVVEKNNIEALAQGIIKGEKLERAEFTYENYDFNQWFNKLIDK